MSTPKIAEPKQIIRPVGEYKNDPVGVSGSSRQFFDYNPASAASQDMFVTALDNIVHVMINQSIQVFKEPLLESVFSTKHQDASIISLVLKREYGYSLNLFRSYKDTCTVSGLAPLYHKLVHQGFPYAHDRVHIMSISILPIRSKVEVAYDDQPSRVLDLTRLPASMIELFHALAHWTEIGDTPINLLSAARSGYYAHYFMPDDTVNQSIYHTTIKPAPGVHASLDNLAEVLSAYNQSLDPHLRVLSRELGIKDICMPKEVSVPSFKSAIPMWSVHNIDLLNDVRGVLRQLPSVRYILSSPNMARYNRAVKFTNVCLPDSIDCSWDFIKVTRQ